MHLLSHDFTVTDIASKGLLGHKVHRNTIHKFLQKRNLQTRKRFSSMPEQDFIDLIRNLANEHPNSGYREIRSLLKTRTPPVKIQRDRLQKILREVDPAGVARRWATTIRRRNYHVPTANYMWHIDTHHKLIRWKLVIDGCIDGYSRVIPYLKAHTNNLAITALDDFLNGVKEFGVPGRVRADGGSEFNHVAKFMNGLDETERLIRGKSVHNQRYVNVKLEA